MNTIETEKKRQIGKRKSGFAGQIGKRKSDFAGHFLCGSGCCAQGGSHSDDSILDRMFFSAMFSVPLISLQPNKVCKLLLITRSSPNRTNTNSRIQYLGSQRGGVLPRKATNFFSSCTWC